VGQDSSPVGPANQDEPAFSGSRQREDSGEPQGPALGTLAAICLWWIGKRKRFAS